MKHDSAPRPERKRNHPASKAPLRAARSTLTRTFQPVAELDEMLDLGADLSGLTISSLINTTLVRHLPDQRILCLRLRHLPIPKTQAVSPF